MKKLLVLSRDQFRSPIEVYISVVLDLSQTQKRYMLLLSESLFLCLALLLRFEGNLKGTVFHVAHHLHTVLLEND